VPSAASSAMGSGSGVVTTTGLGRRRNVQPIGRRPAPSAPAARGRRVRRRRRRSRSGRPRRGGGGSRGAPSCNRGGDHQPSDPGQHDHPPGDPETEEPQMSVHSERQDRADRYQRQSGRRFMVLLYSLAGRGTSSAARRRAPGRQDHARVRGCSVMKSWCSGARSPGPSQTGPTAPCWPRYPSCCQPRCAPIGSSHRARYWRGTAA
jgi:hypothetical protein